VQGPRNVHDAGFQSFPAAKIAHKSYTISACFHSHSTHPFFFSRTAWTGSSTRQISRSGLRNKVAASTLPLNLIYGRVNLNNIFYTKGALCFPKIPPIPHNTRAICETHHRSSLTTSSILPTTTTLLSPLSVSSLNHGTFLRASTCFVASTSESLHLPVRQLGQPFTLSRNQARMHWTAPRMSIISSS